MTFSLDSTCSAKRVWPAEATLRMDRSPAAKPDILADARHLPFKDGVFDRVYCDPPHRLGRHFGVDKADENVRDYDRFQFWPNREAFYSFLKEVDPEFWRVLKPRGKLVFKLPDGDRSHQTMVDRSAIYHLRRFDLINDERVVSAGFFARANVKKGSGRSYIHILTLSRRTTLAPPPLDRWNTSAPRRTRKASA